MAFATSPAFLGAEPHRVTTGPRAGWWILRDEETLGRDLAAALSAAELAEATLAGELPNDVFSASNRTLDAMREAPGVAYADLSEPARARLRDLVLEYVSNSAEDLQTERLLRVERGGWEAVRFGWIAGNGERIYYRVQGPEFLIEYCAVSLSPNHVHTVWRDFDGDFGRDILAEHMNGSAH
jgi:hypothetical protein